MAKAKKSADGGAKRTITKPHSKTSIGRSPNTRPKNKHKARSFKPYRGQG